MTEREAEASHLQKLIQVHAHVSVPNNAHHVMLMAVHVVEDALRPVYAVVGGGIAGVSCAEEVIMCACSIKLGDAS